MMSIPYGRTIIIIFFRHKYDKNIQSHTQILSKIHVDFKLYTSDLLEVNCHLF